MLHRTVRGGAIGSASALIVTIALSASLPASATERAQQHPTVSAAPQGVVHQATSNATQRRHVRAYWSRAKMRNALDGDALAPELTPGRAAVGKVAVGTPTIYGAKQSLAPTAGTAYLGGPWTRSGQVATTTGKVFFTLGGANYVCSAGVVTSINRDLVTTAGHCVNAGPGAFAANFVFVPGYRNGSRPYGTFVARQLTTTSQWRSSGNYNYDVGMAVLNTARGRHVADVVGAQGIAFNQPRGQFLYSFGYPAARPYNGQVLDYCSGIAAKDTFGGTKDQRLTCNLTGGSSGGPWLAGFNETKGTGTQVSLNSFGYDGERNAMYGPYFGSVVQSLYNAAQRL